MALAKEEKEEEEEVDWTPPVSLPSRILCTLLDPIKLRLYPKGQWLFFRRFRMTKANQKHICMH